MARLNSFLLISILLIGIFPSSVKSRMLNNGITLTPTFGGSSLARLNSRGGSASTATAPPSEPIFIEDSTSGGSSFPLLSVDTTADALVSLFGVLNLFHGTILALAPSVGRSLLGKAMDEEDELAAYAEESVGCFALEYGITGYLAASGLTTPEMAIGWHLLRPLLFGQKPCQWKV